MLFILLFVFHAQAFVENVRHGYQSCLACHHSPSGGGLLTDYGRSLSAELMSTFTAPSAERPLFGALKNTQTVNWGGDYRMIQTHSESKQLRRGRQFTMQANVELGARMQDGLWVIGTLGTKEGPKETPERGEFLSERHYVLWSPSADERIRLGKFRLNYGTNDPNHTRYIKSGLGFGSNTESYHLEFTKLMEKGEVILTQTLGRMDLPREEQSEKSSSGQYVHYLGEDERLGFNALIGESPTKRRSLFGTHGVLGLEKKHYVRYEVNYERGHLAQTPDELREVLNSFLSAGTSFAKGVTAYMLHESEQTNLKDHETFRHSPGLGLQWLPFPHVELQAEVKRTYNNNPTSARTDSGWVIVHFYL
jgi:hypothetical protein